ncbi:porin [Curvibacter sp. CHRR-16]|uniref:porin n=1 Tax=Curvibacter sp. CHRR-16 TaxID=2835872 RepID=UPI001BD9C518|nr:porin [Curvibacter sp. CHRR-16]MBT0569645.1 porin [Curvibacter sp. CHRR-16]
MKKTLVALAALAATSSFAQVTITGEYWYGYQATRSVSGADAAGFGVDTASIFFNASEDLGGGLKAGANMAIDTLTRTTASGGDSSINLSGSFGKIEGGYIKGANYSENVISGLAGFDGKVSASRTTNDYVKYTLPAFGPVTVSVGADEASSTDSATGAGSAGDATVTKQRKVGIAAAYAAGPATAALDYAQYDSYEGSNNNNKSRVRVKGSYDLGVAKLGAAAINTTKVKGTYQEFLVGATVPFGNLTIGLDYINSKRDGTGSSVGDGTAALASSSDTTGDVKNSGYGLTASYALSKRTAVSLTYKNWDQNGANRGTDTAVLLGHTF